MKPPPNLFRSRSIALAAGAVSCLAYATQHPDSNAWDQLRPESEAHMVLKRRCQTDAGEEFFDTLEGVKGIYLEAEAHTMAFITGDPSIYGISYTNPPYMFLRNGLSYIEYSSQLPGAAFFGRTDAKEGSPYLRFDTKTRSTESITDRTARVRVNFKRTTAEAEERLGVFGRLIEVVDDATHKVLARRRDFVWLNPDRRGAHGGFVCPTVPEGESLPISFLAKAINLDSYTCRTRFEKSIRELPNKYDSAAHNKLLMEMDLCEADYFRRAK